MIKFKDNYTITDLLDIMRLLRSDSGCPWDREQTHDSIRMNVLEEAYETAEAIDAGNSEFLKEELGDLLLQVVFHAQIGVENGSFDFDSVCDVICKKLIYRHPHVFGELTVENSGEVLKNWEELKSRSKGEQKASDSLENVPKLLPALMRGEKVGKKAANAGFDFGNANEVIQKLKEKIQELEFAVIYKNDGEIEEEFGDILFTCCNLGRFLKKDSEKALTRAINKFIMRFRAWEISK
ncbi:MAG: nucleoside triphosphate pyrophosphohydrolase [Oscillospiraceae bacterium]|jgi:tetrapyrrole methylase family protein/MazG family protein|nr:nucleoside triphosphate pyrophosphohydrolase [Oscillospiraceae bacterium]